MSKARVLADLVAAGGELADGAISASEISGLTASAAELNKLDGVTTTTAELNILSGVTSSATELNKLDGVTASTAELNKLDGVTASAAELSHTTGVTSAIQTQIDTKQKELTPTVVTGNATATKDTRVVLNGSAITLTLPAGPSAGDTVAITEIGGNNNNIIARNGSNIMSLAEDMTVDAAYAAFQLQFVNATIGWAIAQ
tara:strand:- start:30 stop:629 length:600 start_codon:yes stop_codon:yes gene_type:complete